MYVVGSFTSSLHDAHMCRCFHLCLFKDLTKSFPRVTKEVDCKLNLIVEHLAVMYRKNIVNRAYLLRCWQEGKAVTDGKPQWRFSLQEVFHERRRWGFTSLESLLVFLRAELADGEDGQTGESI